MKNALIIIVLLFSLFISSNSFADPLWPIDSENVTICPAEKNIDEPPSFLASNCYQASSWEIDPQNKAIWVKADLLLPDTIEKNSKPYGFYISVKSSSRIYFNQTQLGENGLPSLQAENERAGKMDEMFYIPTKLIKEGKNEVVLFLSSHKGFLNLANPVHFIGVGTYADPSYFTQRNKWRSIIPFGALILGFIYFLVASFNPINRSNNILFLIMTGLAATQLFAEFSRSLFSYSYPIQELRLVSIVILSYCFGTCLLIYVYRHLIKTYNFKYSARWIFAGSFLSLVGVIRIPGFDLKTAVAILIPAFLVTLMLAIQLYKEASKELVGYLIVFVLFCLTIILTFTVFHDILFYYIIGSVLCYLFVQQALAFAKEQQKLRSEQVQLTKLRFKLDQNQQKIKPKKLKLNSAGKVELLDTNLISFCKADGDYVEIHLLDNQKQLYSGSLKSLEKELPSTFLRVHRSYLVNIDFIKTLKTTNNSSSGIGKILLENGSEIPVSRRIMPMVRKVVNS